MQTYRVNEPAVASETIDGEVIVINLESGTYFSLQHTAMEVWQLLGAGWEVESVISTLAECYEPAEQVAPGVSEFLNQLLAEGLMVAAERPTRDDSPAASLLQLGDLKRPFEPPVLNKYSDMQDLLLLDPIHDVDEMGWPNAMKAEAK